MKQQEGLAEQLLAFMQEQAYKPMTYQELEQQFAIRDSATFKAFLQVLTQLEESGQIIRTRANRYGVPERMDLLRGRLQVNTKGFAFLIRENAGDPDVYIHANDMNNAMHGDTVLVRLTSRGPAGGRLEGEVVRVVKRAHERIVGLFEEKGEFAFVLPDEQRIHRSIFVAREHFAGAVDGQKVVVEIVVYPEGRAAAQGRVIEILGHKNDPGVDILSIIRKFQLPEHFSEEVMAEALAVPDRISKSELVGRHDLREKKMVTIDGEDAKDLDDAVSIEMLSNGNMLLGVHIADVGYYVREGSELDREAYNRGTSVYLVDRVIPMLPHRLSNGICSLNPKVDRLTMTCEMEFNERGERVRYAVFPSVICTNERMTYTNVRKILEEPETGESDSAEDAVARHEQLMEREQLLERYADLVEDFRLMAKLAARLRKNRMNRGAIDFDFPEAKIIVEADGTPSEIRKRDRSIAEKLIEEFMLAANEAVAEHFYQLRVPFLYRVHEDPDSEKLVHFVEFAASLGHPVHGLGGLKAGSSKPGASKSGSNRTAQSSGKSAGSGDVPEVSPKMLQKLLEDIKGTPEENVISTVMLRSMKQARYSPDSLGHFGLAAEYYSHFTSPIRRYPDLIIHRVMREVLTSGGKMEEARKEYLTSRMGDIAKQSSERERLAVDAERETDQLKKAQFMQQHIGDEFDGIISSVTSFGMFVALDNTVEGLIRLGDLHDDYYHYHSDRHALIGERTSRMFRLGDPIRILVARVNVVERTIDFAIAGEDERRGRSAGRAGGQGAGRQESGSKGAGRTGGRATGRSGSQGAGGRGAGRRGSGARGAGGQVAGRPGKSGGWGAGGQGTGNRAAGARTGAEASVEAAAELGVNRDSADFVPAPRKKKKPNIWEIIDRKKQTTNAKQKKAKSKDAAFRSDKKGKKKR